MEISWAWAAAGVLFGLIIGSAINAIVWRIKVGKSWTRGRSQCCDCGHTLVAKDLVPVLSWLLLGGRCRYCRKPIKDHPIVELVTAAVFGLSAYVMAPATMIGWVGLGFWLVIASLLLILAAYDARWQLLPNKVMYPCIVVAGLALATMHVLSAGRFQWYDLMAVAIPLAVIIIDKLDAREEWPMVYNVVAVLALLAVVAVLFPHMDRAVGGPILAAVVAYAGFFLMVAASKGRAMGGGDIKLAFAMGLILGVQGTAVALLVAFNVAAAVGLVMIMTHRRKRKDLIPFGPYLVGGTVVAFLFGRMAVEWYLSMNGL